MSMSSPRALPSSCGGYWHDPMLTLAYLDLGLVMAIFQNGNLMIPGVL